MKPVKLPFTRNDYNKLLDQKLQVQATGNLAGRLKLSVARLKMPKVK